LDLYAEIEPEIVVPVANIPEKEGSYQVILPTGIKFLRRLIFNFPKFVQINPLKKTTD